MGCKEKIVKMCYSVPPSILVLTVQTVMARNNEHMLSSPLDHTSPPLTLFPPPPGVTMVITVAIQRMCQSIEGLYQEKKTNGNHKG